MSDGCPAGPTRHAQARARWRSHLAKADLSANFSVGIAGSFTVDSMVPMLGSALLDGGVRPSITLAGYDQIFQTCFDHRRQFGSNPDVIVLLWRIEDLLAIEFTRFIAGDRPRWRMHRRVDELGRRSVICGAA